MCKILSFVLVKVLLVLAVLGTCVMMKSSYHVA